MKDIDCEVQEFWNRVAADWEIRVGEDGDSNRVLIPSQFYGSLSEKYEILSFSMRVVVRAIWLANWQIEVP